MFSNYRLIIMYKKIIANYIKRNHKNIDDSINFLKIITELDKEIINKYFLEIIMKLFSDHK